MLTKRSGQDSDIASVSLPDTRHIRKVKGTFRDRANAVATILVSPLLLLAGLGIIALDAYYYEGEYDQ